MASQRRSSRSDFSPSIPKSPSRARDSPLPALAFPFPRFASSRLRWHRATGGTTLETAAGTATATPSPVDRRQEQEQEQAQPRPSPSLWTEVG
uniref:Uncharacterized protein n=1 Tax=Oryza glumipatula TaxID=40148 RepID=A0A0E0B9I5_9ORYZ